MRVTRSILTSLGVAALIVCAGCKTTHSATSTDTSTTSMASTSSDTSSSPATTPSGMNSTSATANNNYGSSSTSSNLNSGTTASSSTTTTADNGATTTVLPNGSTVTRAETTTIVYPNGTVKTLSGDNSAMTSSSGTESTTTSSPLPSVPPGAAIVTRTTTTITTKTTGVAQTAQTQPVVVNPQPIYVNQPPPMTSSTTIYQPMPTGYVHGRRFPGTNFLIFADRASFSNSNSALSGTLNTGSLGSVISRENGFGIGLNTYLGHSNFSTEFTASRITPRATLTPANTTFNPITGLKFRMEPITGTLQLHFNPRSSVDFYLGGGGAYVMFHPDQGFDAANTGLTGLRFRNEWGPLVNAGFSFGFNRNIGLNFDGKYTWVRANATPTFNTVTIGNVGNSEHIGVNPLILSAGLRFGF